MRLSYLASVLALWPTLGAVAKDDAKGPKIAKYKFEQRPHNIFFFDDSEIALALISDIESGLGEVYRTVDAGEEWEKVEDLSNGDPYVIYPHPTDKKVAVTLGRHKTHWVTYDAGKTWKDFKTKDHPSQTSLPIKFHATNSKRMLFQGLEDCNIFTMACLGKASLTTEHYEAFFFLTGFIDMVHH